MIEISLGKMVLLALIALIVLGPEKLPGAARTAGALLRRVRNGWDSVRSEVEREFEIEEIKRTAREAAARAEALQNEMKEAAQQVHDPVAEAVQMASEPVAPAVAQAAGVDADDPPESAKPAVIAAVDAPDTPLSEESHGRV